MGRPSWRFGLLACAAGAAYCLARDAYWVGYFNDDAFYLIGARSLLAGRFAELNHPAAPPLIQYLPGYPLLLAPLVALFPGTWLPCQLLTAALSAAAAALAAWAFADDLDEEGRLLLMAWAAFNPLALSLSGTVLADVPFVVWTLGFLGTARRVWSRPGAGRWALMGAAAAAAFYLRPTGLALALGLPAALLWERRGRAAAAAGLAAALAVAPWLLRNRLARGHALLYAAELADPYRALSLESVRDPARNLAFYASELYGRTLFRWPWAAGAAAFGLPAAAAGAASAAIGLRRSGLGGGRRLVLAFALLYAGALLAWGKTSTRYLLPLCPIAAASTLAGLTDRRARAAAAGLALLSFVPPGLRIVDASRRRDSPPARAPERTFRWIRERTPADAVFACELDGQLYLRTGRHALTLPRGDEAGSRLPAGVTHVLLSATGDILRTARGWGPHDAVPAEERRRWADADPRLRLAFADAGEGTAVYAVR